MPRPENNPADMPPRQASDAERLWLVVLTELENALAVEDPSDDATGDVYAGSGMWHAPAQLPALPESLRERANALHERQLQREDELRNERTQVGRHLEALRVVPRPRSAAASVYLDVSG
ncbi:hypothetical protein EV379_1879 [Microterricola gilva]|uniref:Uncharacterized protein n=1 Tax=Microterricola gilva TaxID=393267 RepID=A0A4Q8ANI7_9MICO|nr:hypothetical protein [Microterricola gilva]RZU65545.1 hypothetical protein EV379_1879 [Microterricola gilva]